MKKISGNKKLIISVMIIIVVIAIIVGSIISIQKSGSNISFGKKTLNILSGSENEVLEPILEEFEKQNNVNINMTYEGSVDIMQELQNGAENYDAVFPANSIWISMGDTNLKVKNQKSITTTPVVFGIKKSVAEKLGFVGKDVTTKDILEKIQSKELSFMMTSATQSNSGATAYLGFIYALLGNPEVITAEDLDNEELKTNLTTILSGVNRSSGSSDWLKDLFLESDYDAMVNYESIIIDTNKELVARGEEPLYVIYPQDGLGIADSPLGYIDNGNKEKEEIFLKLQDYLISDEVKPKLLELGRRTSFAINFENNNPETFNSDWGIDTKKVLNVMKMPTADVIQKALNMYQTELRKPSLTVYCLDYSGSMAGNGVTSLRSAMSMLLDQTKAKNYMLQASTKDVTIVIPFDNNVLDIWKAEGNDETTLLELQSKIDSLDPQGGTDIYKPLIKAMDEIKKYNVSDYTTSIILMSDGKSNVNSYNQVVEEWNQENLDIPIFSITFGESDDRELQALADFSTARVFDGKDNLEKAFKQAKGYN